MLECRAQGLYVCRVPGHSQVTVVVHVVDVGVLRVGGEVVGDLVIPRPARGRLEGRAQLGEKERLQDHPAHH